MPRAPHKRADAREVGDLRARVGDGLDEHEARRRRERPLDVGDVGRVDERDLRPVRHHRAEQADRVAEEVTARDDVIAFTQQREHRGADRRHARREADGRDTAFHLRHLDFERRGRRIPLPAVGVALRAPLEHRGEVARVAIAVRDRQVQRLVQRAVLDERIGVGMKDRGREPARLVCAHGNLENKKPVRHPPNGFGGCLPWSPRVTAQPRFSGIFYAPAS